MKKVYSLFLKLFSLFFIIFFIIFFTGCDIQTYPGFTTPLTISPEVEKEWTIMIYMDAANNLEPNALDDFNEMEYGLALAKGYFPGIEDYLNIIVIIDRINGYDDSYTSKLENKDWTETRIYQIKPDTENSTEFMSYWIGRDLGELNMGDPDTLDMFINFCKTNFPAKHYALILWDHGGGPRRKDLNSNNNAKAIAWDEESTDSSGLADPLYIDEVQQALKNHFSSTNKLDLLGMDACIMGEVETAYEFRNLASYFVASMANEQADGWDYTGIISNFDSSLAIPDGLTLAKLIVENYRNFIETNTNLTNQTLAAVDLSQISNLKNAIDQLATDIYQTGTVKTNIETIRDNSIHFFDITSDSDNSSIPFFDLYDFVYRITQDSTLSGISAILNSANNVLDALKSAIVASYAGSTYGGYFQMDTSTDNTIAYRGLSITFPRGDKTSSVGKSFYEYFWWYTTINTASTYGPTYLYGNIDFCTFYNNGLVETWKELLEAWYNPTNGSY